MPQTVNSVKGIRPRPPCRSPAAARSRASGAPSRRGPQSGSRAARSEMERGPRRGRSLGFGAQVREPVVVTGESVERALERVGVEGGLEQLGGEIVRGHSSDATAGDRGRSTLSNEGPARLRRQRRWFRRHPPRRPHDVLADNGVPCEFEMGSGAVATTRLQCCPSCAPRQWCGRRVIDSPASSRADGVASQVRDRSRVRCRGPR